MVTKWQKRKRREEKRREEYASVVKDTQVPRELAGPRCK
jgi:hypothetical protein